jgi:hypothetical protein
LDRHQAGQSIEGIDLETDFRLLAVADHVDAEVQCRVTISVTACPVAWVSSAASPDLLSNSSADSAGVWAGCRYE